MSRTGDCWDNAVAQSFFETLKTELVHRTVWIARKAARRAIHGYIKVFNHRQRRPSSLGFHSPAE